MSPGPSATGAAMPDVLSVGEDHSDLPRRTRPGAPCGSDLLSVYLSGGPRYRLDDRTYAFDPPCGMVLTEGTLDTDVQEGKVDGVFVLFRGHGLVGRVRHGSDDVVLRAGGRGIVVPVLKHLRPTDAQRLARILRELAAVPDVGPAAHMQRTAMLLQALAEYCDAADRSEGAAPHPEVVRLRRRIEERACEDRPIASFYSEVALSATHAVALFREAYGVPPVAYRRELRLSRARDLLISSGMNVKQVAFAVGFRDALYFSRVFRESAGVPPSRLIARFRGIRSKGAGQPVR